MRRLVRCLVQSAQIVRCEVTGQSSSETDHDCPYVSGLVQTSISKFSSQAAILFAPPTARPTLNTHKNSPLLLTLLALILGAGAWGVLFWGSSNGVATVDPDPVGGPDLVASGGTSKRATSDIHLPALSREQIEGAGPTNVLWPLEVELDLIAAGGLPSEEGVALLGSGANAVLVGRVGNQRDKGAVAVVKFVAGPNKGRIMKTGADGEFGATNLLPGLALVEVTGPGLVGARREVRLRARRETTLNLGFGRLGTVRGQVIDKTGEPLPQVRVQIDMTVSYTDEEGRFYAPNLASGLAFIELQKEGFASHRENINITANHEVEFDRLKYVMKKGAVLTLTLGGSVGGPGPALAWLTAGNPKAAREFPYYLINPVTVHAGGVTEIRDLPRELISVRIFRSGAECVPPMRNANMLAGEKRNLSMELRSTAKLTGVVMKDGAPVPGAKVTLEAPDQVQAALAFYRQPSTYLESAVLPPIPASIQRVTAGSDGRFTLTAWSGIAPTRYLRAESMDGGAVGMMLVHAEDENVQLDLKPASSGAGVIELELTDRFQGLPIKWRLNGEPGESFVLPPLENLRFEGMREGLWKVRVNWYTDELLDRNNFEVGDGGVASGYVELPEPAVVGQDKEAWIRAGKEYPL